MIKISSSSLRIFILLSLIFNWQQQLFSQGAWTTLPDFPGTSRYAATGFSINGRGYVVTGYHSSGPILLKDTWEFDPATTQWTKKADFPGTARWYASSFAIGGKGYVGLGETTNDFWEFDPVADVWTQKNNFPGAPRVEAVSFSIGTKGYIALGTVPGTSNYMNDVWEYSSVTDTWLQLGNFPGAPRGNAISFVIGQKAYVGTGSLGATTFADDFWEFNPSLNSWVQKQNVPMARTGAVAFSIGSSGYVGMGAGLNGSFIFPQDNWKYNPSTNQWDSVAPLPYYKWMKPVTFTINSYAYVATGFPMESYVWRYTPKTIATSVKTNEIKTLTLIPNPSDGIFTINTSSLLATVRITDLLGRVIYFEDKIKSNNIDLSAELPGVYTVELTYGNERIIKKLVLNR